jgi:hypothetical protein
LNGPDQPAAAISPQQPSARSSHQPAAAISPQLYS